MGRSKLPWPACGAVRAGNPASFRILGLTAGIRHCREVGNGGMRCAFPTMRSVRSSRSGEIVLPVIAEEATPVWFG